MLQRVIMVNILRGLNNNEIYVASKIFASNELKNLVSTTLLLSIIMFITHAIHARQISCMIDRAREVQ